MVRISTRSVAAFAAVAALACVAAAVAGALGGLRGGAAGAVVAGVAVVLAGAAVALACLSARAEHERAGRLEELRALLQVSSSEAETRQLLLRHVGRILPQVGSALLMRNDVDDRLEPTLGERSSDTPLRGLALGRPDARACLALRLGRPQARRGDVAAAPGLVRCDLCQRLAGDVNCEPLRLGDRSVGSLLVASHERLTADQRGQLRDAVLTAGPLLAVQRARTEAEQLAGADPLTHLPNRRAAVAALARLSAQAGRTVTPMAVVLVDLDHFAMVNARAGQAKGDAALAEVAKVLAAGVRASDFVARHGGEEFLVLAPDTDRRGGAELAEKLRRDVERLDTPAAVGRLTASLGVAALPEDATEPTELMRRADRALYAAKALGRNRVEAAEPSITPEA